MNHLLTKIRTKSYQIPQNSHEINYNLILILDLPQNYDFYDAWLMKITTDLLLHYLLMMVVVAVNVLLLKVLLFLPLMKLFLLI